MQVDVSVVVPLYNKGRYISRTLQSVMDQTATCREILVVDDGSTDGGLEFAMAVDDSRIRILKTPAPRSGPSYARNVGISEASGRWVAFLDADDIWGESLLETLYQSLSSYPSAIGAFGSWSEFRCESDIDLSAGRDARVELLQSTDLLNKWVTARSCPIWTSASMFSRAEMLAAGGFPTSERRGEDKDTWLRISRRGPLIQVYKGLAFYRVGVEGQQTESLPTKVPPIVRSINAIMLEATSKEDRDTYGSLKNLEIWHYAKKNKGRAPMSIKFITEFVAVQNPLRFAILTALVALSRLLTFKGSHDARR